MHDRPAKAIYKMASYGASTDLFLWLIASVSAIAAILLANQAAWWLAGLLALFVFWLVWPDRVTPISGGWRWKLAAILAPAAADLISFLNPVLNFPARKLRKFRRAEQHKVYEREDLLELFKAQLGQADNRISADELKLATRALTFGDKSVASMMTARSKVTFVSAGDAVSPMVMDELHKTGQTHFPVVRQLTKAANPEIVGALYLPDLLKQLDDKGRIRDIMHPGAYFINESNDLRQALDAFIKSHHHLLVVVNNFEEITGILTIEDVIAQIFGKKIIDEFENYDSLRSVAGHSSSKERGQLPPAEVE